MDDVTRVHTITYGDFFRDFLLANQLCVFSSEITEDWRSRKEWVTNGKPNLEFLSNRFGKSKIFFFSFARSSWITIKIVYIITIIVLTIVKITITLVIKIMCPPRNCS